MNIDEKDRKNSGLLLLALIFVGTMSLAIVPKFNLYSKSQKKDIQVAQSPSVADLKAIGVDANSAEVLGDTTSASGSSGQSPAGACTGGRICDTNMALAPVPLCSEGDGSGTMVGGSASEGGSFVNVKLNAKVEPFVVTTPQVLLQGSKYVDDSRKIISYDYPVYRDSQNVVLYDEARRGCAPGVDCKDYDSIAGIKDSPFKVQSYIEVPNADGGGHNGKGNTVIYSVPSLRSACPDIQNAKANPRRSAQFTSLLDVKRQMPTLNGAHATTRSFGSIQCLRNPPKGSTLEEAKNFKMCITEVKPTDFIVAAVYGIKQWLDCLIGDDVCEEAKVFAIRIDPIYGGQMKCARPDCSVRYFEYEYLKSKAPGDAGSQIPEFIDKNLVNVYQPVTESYYIETPCKIRINKWGVHDIPCIWDISPYRKQFEIQKAAFMPLDPTMPQTFKEYWDGGVLRELRQRSVSCI